MGIIQSRYTPARWSDEDTEYLINNAGKLPTKIIAENLGRTPCAIQRKASFEGISLIPGKNRKSTDPQEKRFKPSTISGYDMFIMLMCKLQKVALNTTGRIELSLDNLKQAYEIVRKSEATLYRGCVR